MIRFCSDLTSVQSLRFMCHCGAPMARTPRDRLKAIDLPLTKCLNASSEASWRRDEDAPLLGATPLNNQVAKDRWHYNI